MSNRGPLIRTVLLVPTRDNSGRPFPRPQWTELERRLATTFGGYSWTAGVHGAWEHQGRVYRDVSRQYLVTLQSWTQLGIWLDLVHWVRRTFQQEALYIEVAGVPEIISGEA